MTSLQLKILAATLMVIDHVGDIFFPNQIWLRAIGRLSFPIFAWLIATGFEYTKNLKTYFLRILAFAFISQIPYSLAFQTITLNILFTFSLSIFLLALLTNKIALPSFWHLLIYLFTIFISFFIDGGFYGVFLPLGFYYFRKSKKAQLIFTFCLTLGYVLVNYALSLGLKINPSFPIFIQLFAVFALPLIFLYNQKQGLRLKYFFYIFYPAHLTILYLVSLVVKL